MSDITLTPPSAALADSLLRITTDQYHQMLEGGIIREDSSTELLNGLMIQKDRRSGDDAITHGAAHRHAVRLLTKLAARIDGEENHFQVQLPIHISKFDEPEPDAAVIMGPDSRFAEHLPTAADVACVIEVSDSSLDYDLHDKLPKYAAAGIPQYVVVNLREDCVDVYTKPDLTGGVYGARERVSVHGVLQLSLGGDRVLAVLASDVLP